MNRPRLQLLRRLLTCVLLVAGGAVGQDLPLAVDLQADAQVARAERVPIVLFFYSKNCPFCREVEELYLKPLQKENSKTQGFLLRRIEISETRPLRTFTGIQTDFRRFAQEQKVTLVPHLRFVGPQGERLAADLVGLSSRDFYGGYLDDSIAQAQAKLSK